MDNNNSLYKFMRFDKYGFLTLLNKQIYFAKPTELNDPYDCSPNFKIKNLENHTLQDYQNFFKKNPLPNRIIYYGTSTGKNFKCDFEEYKKENDIEEHARIILDKEINLNYGICSFSTDKFDPRLWTHYADSAYGFCIEFDKETLIKDFEYEAKFYGINLIKFEEIRYNIKIQKLQQIEILDGNVVYKPDYLMKKTKEWKYEGEFRALIQINNQDQFNNTHGRCMKFPNRICKSIILGERVEDNTIAAIKNTINRPIFKAYRVRETNKLEFKQIY